MNLQKIPISKIKPAAYNPRKDLQPGDLDYEKLKQSIDQFDLVEPLIWNKKTGNLIGGHQRLKILRARGDTEIDVSVVSLSLAKEKALNIALNKIQGAWDLPKLKDLLQELDTGEFDIGITGFDMTEIENLVTANALGEGHERPGFDDKTHDKGEVKDHNWFYVTYYGEPDRFTALVKILESQGALKTQHEVDAGAFEKMVNASGAK